MARGSWLVAALRVSDSPRAHVSVNDTQRRDTQQGKPAMCWRWRGSGGLPLARLPLQPTPFPLGHAAPDPEPFVVLERVLQALGSDFAAAADPLRLPGRSSLLREERLRVRLRAQSPVLPAKLVNVFRTDEHLRQRDDDLRHSVSSPPT